MLVSLGAPRPPHPNAFGLPPTGGGDLSQVRDLSQGEGFKPGPGLDLASRALRRISVSGFALGNQ